MDVLNSKIIVAKIANNHYMLSRACSDCSTVHHIKVRSEDYHNWNFKGQHIQYAFPYLSANERELLISGICGTCFDKMFEEKE